MTYIGTAGGDDIVTDLLAVPFSRRMFHEKMDIVKKGRPTPKHLELNQPAKAGYVLHFQASHFLAYMLSSTQEALLLGVFVVWG